MKLKEYGFNTDVTHGAIIYEKGSKADTGGGCDPEDEGVIVGTSEWAWIEEDDGRRICAALKFFSDTPTKEIERLADRRFAASTFTDVERVVDLMCQIYAYNCVGANAHIVLDDGNLEDAHIAWCLDKALMQNIHNSTKEQLEVERKCLQLMRDLSPEERLEAYETFWCSK